VRVHLAFHSAPAVWFSLDVLHEPLAGLRHNAAAANVTLEAVGPHGLIVLLNLLGGLGVVGTPVVLARGRRSHVPVPGA